MQTVIATKFDWRSLISPPPTYSATADKGPSEKGTTSHKDTMVACLYFHGRVYPHAHMDGVFVITVGIMVVGFQLSKTKKMYHFVVSREHAQSIPTAIYRA